MNARPMPDHEWMRHMQGRLRGLQALCVVAMVGAFVARVVW